MDDLDGLEIDAQRVGDDLRKDSFMALAMRVAAGQDGHAARRVDAHLSHFILTAETALLGQHLGRPHAAGFHIEGKAQSQILAAREGRLFALLERGKIANLISALEQLVELADIIGPQQRRLVGKGVGRNEIAPPDLNPIDIHLARRRIHRAFENISAFGPSGAAIGIDRHRVGEGGARAAMDSAHLVGAGHRIGIEEGGDRRREGEGKLERFLAPSWSRACVSQMKASERSATHLTGRFSLCAAKTLKTSSA